MKAVSVEQPFAHLITKGEKTIEVHPWKTDHRGDLLICSSKLPAYSTEEMEELEEDWGCEFLYGYALCVVNLVEVRGAREEDEEAACLEGIDPDAYSWVFENLRPVIPFPVKTQQGLFDVDEKLIKLPPFQIGDSAVVKDGILDPDFEEPIGGWQGRVKEIIVTEEDEFLIGLEWDSITLKGMPPSLFERSEEKGLEWTEMYLDVSELEPTQPRDTEEEALKTKQELSEKYESLLDQKMDEQEERIFDILEIEDEEDEDEVEVNDENLKKYLDYLKQNIESPCRLTGREDFPWEEYYVLGPGSKKEYEKLKKSQPSYTDEFELVEFDDEVDLDDGILVNVRRISDKKRFSLPLADLEVTDRKSRNSELLDDYSFWFVNYR